MPNGRAGTSELVYKICNERDWAEACAAGRFMGSSDDKRDGYIHLSTADQVPGTLARHFAGVSNLMLIGIDTLRLGPALVWERSRGDALFPHLYGALGVSAAVIAEPLALTVDGSHVLPPWLRSC